MSATMLAIVISRQMTIGPKKLSRAKDYHKLQNTPTILSSSREKKYTQKMAHPVLQYMGVNPHPTELTKPPQDN